MIQKGELSLRQKKEKTRDSNQKEKLPLLLGVLRYLSVFAAMFVWFPLLLATETYFQALTNNQTVLIRFGLVIVCGFIGFFVSMLLSALTEKLKYPSQLNMVFCVLLCVIPAGFMYLCCGSSFASYRTVCMMVYGVLAFWMGTRFYYRPYSKINTTVTLAWSCGLHVAVMLILMLVSFNYGHNIVAADMPLSDTITISAAQRTVLDPEALIRIPADGFQYDFSLFIPEFLIYIAIFGMVRNQSHIDFLMERRKHKIEDLPKWVRTYNMQLTSMILAVIAVLFLCKDWIIKGIKWMASTLGYLIVRGMDAFGRMFIHEEFEDLYVPEAEEAIEDFVIEESGAVSNVTMIFSYIFVAVLIVTVVWLLVHFRVFSKLWRMLKESRHERVKVEMVDNEYVDSETELDQNARKSRKNERASAYKQWRQQYKQFLKIKQEDRRYEQGFLLLTDYFRLRGVALSEGDTAMQVNQKVVKSKKLDQRVGDDIVEGYHLLCYAGKGCTKEKLTVLEGALQKAYTDSRALKVVGV